MRLLHLADLHIGKRISGYSLIEDHKHFLDTTVEFIKENNIDTVAVAGDVYDTTIPPVSAINIVDEFLTEISELGVRLLMIPGNHDSEERLNYASSFFKKHDIHIVTDVAKSTTPIVIDGINFYLVPFCNHYDVNSAFKTDFRDYDSAYSHLIEELHIDESKCNIILAHQMFLPSGGNVERGNSEEISQSDSQNIRADVLKCFDYACLGHIHKPQNIGKNIRYCGSPLAYHSDEARYEKSYTVVDIEGKNISVSTYPIKPLRRVIVLKDMFDEILTNKKEYKDDYVYLKLTDPYHIDNAIDQAKQVFPYTLGLEYVFDRVSTPLGDGEGIKIDEISLEDLFRSFYLKQNGTEMSEFQLDIIKELMEEENEAD